MTLHADPERCSAAEEYNRRYRPDPAAPAGPAAVARTGRSELHATITDDVLRAAARDEEHFALLRALGMTSVLSVPVAARKRTFGALTLVGESGRHYDEADLGLAEELARRIALAIDNARLYQESCAAAERTTRLQPVTAGLGRAITPAQVADTVVGQGMSAFQAAEGILCLTSEDGRWLEIVRSSRHARADAQ